MIEKHNAELLFQVEYRYTPCELARCSRHVDKNVFVVDTEKAITSNEDKYLFEILMQEVFGWNMNCGSPIEQSTVYFDVGNESVFGGVWNTETNLPATRLLIIDKQREHRTDYSPYIYSGRSMKIFLKCLQKSD